MTLSQRIALLTGADRAVDAEVAVAIFGLMPDWKEAVLRAVCPHFTADLNAAMSVVPEGSSVDLAIDPDGLTEATVTTEEGGSSATGATPAIALLSAAMMARGL